MLILHYNYFNVWFGQHVAHCAFEITLLQAIMLTLLLVCSFSPKVQSIFWGPRICDSALSLNKAMLRQILILRRFVRYFFVQGKLHKKCHTFPSQLPLYFIKYAPSILFLKILKYYNSTILYNSPKKSHFCATFAHSMHIFKYFHTFF